MGPGGLPITKSTSSYKVKPIEDMTKSKSVLVRHSSTLSRDSRNSIELIDVGMILPEEELLMESDPSYNRKTHKDVRHPIDEASYEEEKYHSSHQSQNNSHHHHNHSLH